MFSGIIDHTGKITSIKKRKKKDITIFISTEFKTKDIKLGSSICCNGICLTVCTMKKVKTKLELSFDVSNDQSQLKGYHLLLMILRQNLSALI